MDIRVDVSGGFCILLAILCLILPLEWLLASIAAALCHEAFHILAVILMGGKIQSLALGTHGAVMKSSPMAAWQELICILAGPAGSFILLFLTEYVPKTALCGLVQGLYNLLPLYPLDGGRALYYICAMVSSEKNADRICAVVRKWIMILMLCGAIFCKFFYRMGILPAFFALFLLSRPLDGKISCKEENLRVQ